MRHTNDVYFLEGLLEPIDEDHKCEVCGQLISLDEGEARRIEHSWTQDTWRHKTPEHCINVIAKILAAYHLDATH